MSNNKDIQLESLWNSDIKPEEYGSKEQYYAPYTHALLVSLLCYVFDNFIWYLLSGKFEFNHGGMWGVYLLMLIIEIIVGTEIGKKLRNETSDIQNTI